MAVLLIVFMACTSISSAQLIAMSSIFSFDIYGTYINKAPTNKQLIKVSGYGVIGSWVIISSLSTALFKGGVDLNWLLYFLGILIWSVLFTFLVALTDKSNQPRHVPYSLRPGLETSTPHRCNSCPHHWLRRRSLGLGRLLLLPLRRRFHQIARPNPPLPLR